MELNWSKRMGSFDYDYYTRIENFVLIKETKKAIYLKLNNNLNIWFPKSCVKNFNNQSAYVWSKIYISNIYREREKQKIKLMKLKFPHNAIIAKEFTQDDIEKFEKELDAKME